MTHQLPGRQPRHGPPGAGRAKRQERRVSGTEAGREVGEKGAISLKEGNKECNKMRCSTGPFPPHWPIGSRKSPGLTWTAYETILCPLAGTQIDETHLLHLAPAVCPRFRGIKVGKRILERTSNTKRTMLVRLP